MTVVTVEGIMPPSCMLGAGPNPIHQIRFRKITMIKDELHDFLIAQGYVTNASVLGCPGCSHETNVEDWEPEDDYNRITCEGCSSEMQVSFVMRSMPCPDYPGYRALESQHWVKAIGMTPEEDL